jgi:RimJ/RimL family protein N-acetyltransferase
MYELGFDVLRFDRAHFEVRKANTRVVAFHERAGARLEREDEETCYYGYRPTDYLRFRSRSLGQVAEHRALVGA